ncbi:MAG: DMT family transporter [Firmicutes bacterium]|nr:DMT family transporter [Bacillota bacterium]
MGMTKNIASSLTVKPREHIYGYTILVLSAMIWGTEAILVKLCYNNGFSIINLLSLRYAASLPVFVLLTKLEHNTLTPTKELLFPLLKLSANVLAGVIMLYLALALLPATLAILFFYAYPSFTSLLHMLLKRGPLGASRFLALIISGLGLILLYWSSNMGLSLLGVACALASALLQAGKLFQTASLLPRIGAAKLNLFNAFTTTIAVSLIYIIQASINPQGFALTAINGLGWLYMLTLGMIVTVFGNLFMTIGIKNVGAVDTSLVLLLEPLTTAALAFLIFGDVLSSWQMLGGLLILLAVALPATANLRRA